MNTSLAPDELYSEQRRREPSHSRAGLTSIGLKIKRTPLPNQTSPLQGPYHRWKNGKTKSNKWSSEQEIAPSTRENAGFEQFVVVVFRVEALSFVRQSGRAARPQTTDPSAPEGKQRGFKKRDSPLQSDSNNRHGSQ